MNLVQTQLFVVFLKCSVGHFLLSLCCYFLKKNSLNIVRKLLGEDLPDETIEELQQEAISEIGNIVLNACIGAFSESLDTDFKIDLPVFEISKPLDLLDTSENKNETALFIRIDLTLSASDITGYMAFLMGTLSLTQLKDILKKMLGNL